MTTGDKIAKLRKEHNWTQEQFADRMEVSRQSVSKWESGVAFPETEKLIKMSELFSTSIDYLLREEISQPEKREDPHYVNYWRKFYYEYRSKRTLFGLPLVHINCGIGRTATGVFALGLKARGIVSIGCFSVGVLSFGVLSVGALSLGVAALGLLALGSIAVGAVAFGAVAVGIWAIGALALGVVANGAAAFGHFLAIGDFASAQIALGGEQAHGSLYEHASGISGQITGYDAGLARKLLSQQMTGIWDGLRRLVEVWITG